MFLRKYIFYLFLLHSIIAIPQINLYDTDRVSESDNSLQHDCLRIHSSNGQPDGISEIISYCMSEFPSKFNIDQNVLISKFTFAELSKENISTQQLYLWSAPIDLIERYQLYLSTSNDLSMASDIFYNCTWPRFGPKCEYQFDYQHPNNLSLSDIINDFYRFNKHNPTTFTCYTHLQCNRGPSPSCLDWTEICDGKVDCLDGGFDEQHCWQIEINECKDNEYRCTNGQCIPLSINQDEIYDSNCVNNILNGAQSTNLQYSCQTTEPSFICEESKCQNQMFTSSCVLQRQFLLEEAMYSVKDNTVDEDCWSALKCIFHVYGSKSICNNLCENNTCVDAIIKTCPGMLFFPNVPIFFGYIYLALKKDVSQSLLDENLWSLYVCYDNTSNAMLFNMTLEISFKNKTCYMYQTKLELSSWGTIYHQLLYKLHNELKNYQLVPSNYNPEICNRSSMYQCINSFKCISIYRLFDGNDDCPYMDDENINVIDNIHLMEQLKKTHFKCQISNKYISRSLIKNGVCDCGYFQSGWCDDEDLQSFNFQNNISFQTICDGYVELLPVMINGRIETDETECQQWACNNIYTRCNGIWNCLNGEDETGCHELPESKCPSKSHLCVTPLTNQFMCLPIGKANDGTIDCLGATDEPQLCRQKHETIHFNNFYCMNQTLESCINYETLCDGTNDCEHGDDEQFCEKNRTFPQNFGICAAEFSSLQSDVEKFICNQMQYHVKLPIIHFTLGRMSNSNKYKTKNIENTIFSSSSITEMSYQSRCNRGLDLRVWLNNSSTTNTCLCPPSYYGDSCQYQNQRISLTVQFQALSHSLGTLFTIVISLIDDSDQRTIHSYEQISYLPARDCKTKFNRYLLYSTRPKDSTKNYSIHIDIYEKVSLIYRGSLLFPINFPFLPVHRLSFLVDIPSIDNTIQSCSNDQCVHGKCIRYSNNLQGLTFCQCDQGWSGRYCTIPHSCMCSSDSLCIGVSANNNRSICVCPMNKFGPRCLLTDAVCQDGSYSICQNGGQCISNDNSIISNQKFTCICPKGFTGDRCEIADSQLILSFDKRIVASESILIHFIKVSSNDRPVRSTTFQTIPSGQDSSVIYWSEPFHLVFVELFNKNYYLTVVQNSYQQSTTIDKMIKPSDRCPIINELFNETIIQMPLLRRIKYYHLPCQNQSLDLSCFYDDVHICLCSEHDGQRVANCFNFDHNIRFDCQGQSECENGGLCLQDTDTCPKRSMCICHSGFYGSRCQFYQITSSTGLPLNTTIASSTDLPLNTTITTSTGLPLNTTIASSTGLPLNTTITTSIGLSLNAILKYHILLHIALFINYLLCK